MNAPKTPPKAAPAEPVDTVRDEPAAEASIPANEPTKEHERPDPGKVHRMNQKTRAKMIAMGQKPATED